ncbi:TPA: CAP domain-containing protein, partial [Pseudomonas aeruginosa]
MAIPSIPRLAVLTLGLALAAAASAADEAQLIEAINAYRGQVQSCGGQASGELPPLAADPRLALPVNAAGDLQQAMAQAAYPMVNVQSISLSGPRDAGAAMKALEESFCRVVLDPQFVDVGVSRQDRDWRIVLARPLLRGGMGDWQAEGQKLLERINAARGQARQCGGKPYAAAQPLAWNATLGGAAEAHSRAMANGNFFDHL